MITQAPILESTFRQTDTPIAQNWRMPKLDIKQAFARNLKAAMKKKGLTQTALGAKAGVSQGAVSEAVNQVTSPSIDTVNDLAYALGMQAWELLVDSEATRRAVLDSVLGGESGDQQKNREQRARS